MNKPIPTSAAEALGFLMEASLVGTSRAIENQEARGQRQLVNSEVLPTRLNGCKPALEKLGFQFIGEVERDPLFQRVNMPQGWKKQATDHSMWSDLVDDKGRRRGSIFYKAAFYDRDAFLNLNTRYGVKHDYAAEDKDGQFHYVLTDAGVDLEALPPSPKEISGMARWDVSDAASKAAWAVLAERFPQHEDPTAYWD